MRRFGTILAVPFWSGVLAAVVAQRPAAIAERAMVPAGGASVALQFSPDGGLLASGGDRGDVVLVDSTSGTGRHVLDAGCGPVGSIRFSDDGSRLAIAAGEVTLWDVATGMLLQRAHARGQHLAAAPDGRWFAAGSGTVVALLRAEDLGEVRAFAVADEAHALAFSPDARRLAIALRDGVHVVDVETGAGGRDERRPGIARDLAWLDDGRLVQLQARSLHGYSDTMLALGASTFVMAAARDGSRVLVSTLDDVVLVRPGAELVRIAGGGIVALHPDGERWARARDGAIELFRGTERERSAPCAHRSPAHRPGGTSQLLPRRPSSLPGALPEFVLADEPTLRIAHTLVAPQHGPRQAALTGDGRLAVVAGTELHVFDVTTGARIEIAGLPHGVLVPHPQGTELVLLRTRADRSGSDLESWAIDRAAANARRLRTIATGHVPMPMLAGSPPRFSADARRLLVGHQLLDLDEPHRSRTLGMPQVHDFVLTHDERYAVAWEGVDDVVVAHGSIQVFSTDGDAVDRRDYVRPPTHVAASPFDARIAVCHYARGGYVEVMPVPGLAEPRRFAWSWREAAWLSRHHLLGVAAGSLQLGDLRTGTIVASARIDAAATGLVVDRVRRIALAPLPDRVLVLRFDFGAESR